MSPRAAPVATLQRYVMRALVSASLAIASISALATGPIYRCGPEGNVYTQNPCKGGAAINSDDPRSAAQRADARAVTQAEQRRAAELERERRAAERTRRPALAGGIDSVPKPAPAASAPSSTARQPSHRPRRATHAHASAQPASGVVVVVPQAPRRERAK